MRPHLSTILRIAFTLIATLTVASLPSHAERDIVYGARYYAQPHSKIQTYFHIYRINPDGTRKTQLTFGNHNDTFPVWASEGQIILFYRGEQACRINANGGKITPISKADPVIKMLHEEYPPSQSDTSPDGKWKLIKSQNDNTLIVGSPQTTRKTVLKKTQASFVESVWLSPATLFGTWHIEDNQVDGERIIPFTWQPNAPNVREMKFTLKAAIPPGKRDSQEFRDPSIARQTHLQGIPKSTRYVLFSIDQSSSTVRPNHDFYRVDASNGWMAFWLHDKQFVTFSPDGIRFCTAPGRDISPYKQRRFPLVENYGIAKTMHLVWTAPLQIGDTETGKVHTISKGFVWVIGADWRK